MTSNSSEKKNFKNMCGTVRYHSRGVYDSKYKFKEKATKEKF